MLKVCRQHLGTLTVGMHPVSFEERCTIPEQVKIVNKKHVLSATCRVEPGVQAKNAAKKIDFPVSFKTLKRRLKSFFGALRLPTGSVSRPYMQYYTCDGGWE